MENTKIPETILAAATKRFNLPLEELKTKQAELIKQFLESEATVYCEDCGLVFYSGPAFPVANERQYVDWKMLSFRHVWDNKHKVKIYLPSFLVFNKMLEKKNLGLAKAIKTIREQALGFDANEHVCYYLEVERLRKDLVRSGDACAYKSNDVNWDAGSRCACSVCHKEYYDPKQACLCHSESKPWLPMSEVNGIKVRRF